MATVTPSYSSPVTITMDQANLASSATLVAGVECAQVDNTSNKYMDVIVKGAVSVGTTPTANTAITVFAWGADVSLATTAIDVLDGTSSAETLTNTGVLLSLRVLANIPVLATTSDIAYPVLPTSVARLFGGVVPKFWGLYLSHNTGVNLRNNAVNTDSFEFVGVKYDVA